MHRSTTERRRWRVPGAIAALLLVAACASPSGRGSSTGDPTSARTDGAITVSAAASLTEAFRAIGRRFEQAHRGADVTFNFGSSSTLATQVEQGAPADVFASADRVNTDRLLTADLIATPVVFARNQLVIVTKPGNPQHVRTLVDLAELGTVALCGAEVPCGRYADQVLQQARVELPEVSRGQDVKATLGAVTHGDADAAIVYATDAEAAGKTVTVLRIPPVDDAIATYPIAVVKGAASAGTARAFVGYVTSRAGESVLRSYGFLPPG